MNEFEKYRIMLNKKWIAYLSIPWWKRWLYLSPDDESFYNYLECKYNIN